MLEQPRRLFTLYTWLLMVGVLLAACGARPTPIPTPEPPFSLVAPSPTTRPADAPLFVLGHFRDADEPHLREALGRFAEASGVQVEYEAAAGMAERLRELAIEGRTPDVILLPIPTWLREMAAAGAISPLDGESAATIRRNFGPAWEELVSYNGDIYGVPLDANAKSLLWYRLAAFAEWGVEPPESLDGLFEVAEEIDEQGQAVFAVVGEPGWPLTDWFESVLLATAGPEVYDDLAAHRIAWTDPAVEAAAEQFVALLRDEWLMRGARGAATMPLRAEPFTEAFDPTTPGAAMWLAQGSIARPRIAESGFVEEEFGFFPLPAEGGIVGIGAVAVGTNRSEPTMALLQFLAEPEAVERWVADGGFISPNLQVPLDSYPTDLARQEAALLREASLFRYDLSDLLPPNLGFPFLGDQLREMILRPDEVTEILAEIETVARREQGTAEQP